MWLSQHMPRTVSQKVNLSQGLQIKGFSGVHKVTQQQPVVSIGIVHGTASIEDIAQVCGFNYTAREQGLSNMGANHGAQR